MKSILSTRNSLLWGVLALVIGPLIAINPTDTLNFSVQLVGLLILVIGLIQLISFLGLRKQVSLGWSAIPLGGVLGLIFGLLLLITPTTFVAFFMYLLGAFIIFLGVMQIVSLIKIHRLGVKTNAAYYIFPVLLAIAGSLIFFFPLATSAWIVIFAGVAITFFGLTEIIACFAIKLPSATKKEE